MLKWVGLFGFNLLWFVSRITSKQLAEPYDIPALKDGNPKKTGDLDISPLFFLFAS